MAQPQQPKLADLPTPFLVIRRQTAAANAQRMLDTAARLGVRLRPHIKTHKTVEGALMQTGGRRSGVVVSTLAEARMLQAEGFSDVLYAVPLGVDKVPLACQLAADLPDFQVLVDGAHVLAALAAAAASVKLSQPLGVWIKIDCGYGRAGLPPTATDHLVAIVRQLEQSTVLRFAGLYTHGGMSYECRSVEAIQAVAAREREALRLAAAALVAAGLPAPPQTAVGATPTCSHPPADGLAGVTETHPGNYLLYDAMQCTITSCRLDDVAVRVYVRIVGAYPERNELLLDAGWTAVSAQGAAVGYGLIEGHPNLRIKSLSQETGVVQSADGSPLDFEQLKPGTLLAIVPYHSCAACAMHTIYHVVESKDSEEVSEIWRPCRGW